MTSLAQQPMLTDTLDAPVAAPRFLPQPKTERADTGLASGLAGKREARRAAKRRALTGVDEEIVATLNRVKHDLACLHNRYDNTSDELLLESIIYEIKAANVKYQYYLKMCKDKGIVNGIVG